MAAAETIHEFPHLRANLTNLIGAATDGDVARVTELIGKGCDVNRPNEYGFTALHHAARK
jgi:ankyrin repeat protein